MQNLFEDNFDPKHDTTQTTFVSCAFENFTKARCSVLNDRFLIFSHHTEFDIRIEMKFFLLCFILSIFAVAHVSAIFPQCPGCDTGANPKTLSCQCKII